jgi:serine/threonine protein kinase
MTEQLNLEIGIMYKINHPNSLQLINHFEDDDKIYMIMNYISNGNLFNLMKSKGKLSIMRSEKNLNSIISQHHTIMEH